MTGNVTPPMETIATIVPILLSATPPGLSFLLEKQKNIPL